MSINFPPTLRPQGQASTPSKHFEGNNDCVSLGPYDTATKGKRSLDLTQQIEKKLAEYNASNSVIKRWLLELCSWTTSALSMVAVVGIYIYINGKIMTDNELALNCANVLGKIASAALIVPTSEALGQLKWNWFHNSKAIWDFEIFDKASRGPWGAALLLYRTKGRSLAALGALLVVLLLAIDTFFQQVVEYDDRWALESTTGTIPRAVKYDPFYVPEYFQGSEMGIMDRAMEPVIKEFYFNNGTQAISYGNGTRPDIPLSCPTSNCTWPAYETLAVCSRCTEISDLIDLSFACLNTTIDWSTNWDGPIHEKPYPIGEACGYFLNATSVSPILLSGYSLQTNTTLNGSREALLVRVMPLTEMELKRPLYGVGSVAFKHHRYPMLDFVIASTAGGVEAVYQHKQPAVHECALSWCPDDRVNIRLGIL